MDETLTKLVDVVKGIAEGKGVQLNLPRMRSLIAQKGAEVIGALVSDSAWKKAKAAGEGRGDKIRPFADADQFNREH
jgi:hypothetical protein